MEPLDLSDVTAGVHATIPILGAMEVKVVELRSGYAAAELPSGPNVNHFGVSYAGSLFSAAEMLGGALSMASFDLDGFVPLVKDVAIRFRRPAMGVVRAETALPDAEVDRVQAEALAQGKAEFVLEATLTDAEGTVVATTVGTYQVRRMA